MKRKIIFIAITIIAILFIISGLLLTTKKNTFDKNKELEKIKSKLEESSLISEYGNDGYQIIIRKTNSNLTISLLTEGKNKIVRFKMDEKFLTARYDSNDEIKKKMLTFVLASLSKDADKVTRILTNDVYEYLTLKDNGVYVKNRIIYIDYNNLNVESFNLKLTDD